MDGEPEFGTRVRRLSWAAALTVMALAALRLCHVHLLWADEDYHLAAALHILHGKIPYRDFWYDKPPLSALYYLLVAAYPGWPLRLLDTGYVLTACYCAYRVAREWWGRSEGYTAAFLLAFFLAFYLPSATIAFAADALMIVPHLAAIYFVLRGRALAAGLYCGMAFLVNVKAVFVLAVCFAWWPGGLMMLCAGFAIPVTAAAGVAAVMRALPAYWQQVWRWGLLYAKDSPVVHPIALGLTRTLDWLGFHAALAAGTTYTVVYGTRQERWRLGSWLGLSFVAVCLGTRFAPHYFLQLLPPMTIAGARGAALGWHRRRRVTAGVMALLLLVPLVRFGPRYVTLAVDNLRGQQTRWADAALDLDSQDVAGQIGKLARAGDTLFVWGYRPDIYVYTRLVSDSVFWDSQPLTGVPADRHLQASHAIYGGAAAENRLNFANSHPTFLVDGLGLLNPHLRPAVYPELQPWLAHYRLMGRTKLSLIYRRTDEPPAR